MRKYVVDHTNTWKLVAILAALVGIIALGIYTFQQRNPIIEAVSGTKLFMRALKTSGPSEETKQMLIKYVDSNSLVIGVNIGSANFQENTRTRTFHYSKIEDINKAWASTTGMKLPLFTDNTFHNARIVSLINGEFVCTPTKDTVLSKSHPVLNNYSHTTCTVAIPPGYGDFVGWINFFLADEPTFNQMQSLKRVAEKIATEVYERDIVARKNGRATVLAAPQPVTR